MAEDKKKVLIIEDEASMANILRDRLTLEGYEVLVSHDGEVGIKTALDEHPDFILLDIVLPKKNGAEVLKELLDDDWGKTASITCLTNLMKVPNSVQKAMETHKNIEYIVKVNTRLDAIIEHIKGRLAE